MSQDETLRIVAEVKDKFSGVLDQFKKKAAEAHGAAAKGNNEAAKAAREHAKRIKELHERMAKTKATISDALTPALAALGISGIAAGEAFGKLTEKLKEAGESYNIFNDIAKRGGVTAQYVDAVTMAFQRLGVAPEAATSSVANLGEHLDRIAGRDPEELNSLTQAFGNMGTSLRTALDGATGREDAMKRIFSFMSEHPNVPVWQKRKWLETLGIDPSLATQSIAEIKEAFEKADIFERDHPRNQALYKQLDKSFADLREAQAGFWRDMVNTFGPNGIKVIEGFATATGKAIEQVKSEFSDLAEVMKLVRAVLDFDDKISGPVQRFLGYGDQNPIAKSIHGGLFAPDDKEQKIQEPVKQGVLDAFRQWMFENKVTDAEKFAGGYTPMAYHPGIAAAQRAFGGGGYRLLPNGDSGSGLPGAAPEGSNADKGVGGVDLGAGSGMSGSDYLKARRDRFAKELQNNPHVRDEVKGMMLTEGTPQHSLEALMNRMDFMGGSLHGGLHSGFYGPINHGKLPGAIAELHRKAKLSERYDAIIDKVLNGSDLIKGYTDQGMPTDPNGHLRAPGHPYMHLGGNDFTDWVGPKGREAARLFREAQEKAVNASVSTAHAHLRDHIRHHGTALNSAKQSGLMGGASTVTGDASLRIDLNGFPKGTRYASKTSGMFKEVQLNRGRPMQSASQDG